MSETSKSYGVNDGTTCPTKRESVAVAVDDDDVHALLHPEPTSIEWTASIMLPVYPHCKGGGNAAFNTTPPKTDICLYLDKKGQLTVKLYFCPRAYPPNIFNNSGSVSDEGAETLKELHALINSAAIDASSEVAIGTSVLIQGKFQRVYLCKVCNSNNGRVRNGDNEEEKEEEREAPITNRNFRETNLVNNKNGKGRRKVGRGAPGLIRRQSKTSKAIKCPFRFKLMVDEFGFYISVSHGSGCPCHHGHLKVDPRFAPTPMRSLTKEEKVDAKLSVKATVNKAAGVNFMRMKYNKNLSYAQINQLDCLDKAVETDEYGSLFTMFEQSKNIRYSILWTTTAGNCTNDVKVITSSKVLGDVEVESLHTTAATTTPSLQPVVSEAIQQRQDRDIAINEQAFHCIAWCNEDVLRYFVLNPEVISLDVTSHTNKSGFQLLTFSCRTSVDRQAVFCRVWIPDQRRVSFRYVFQHALKKLLPNHARQRVRLVMKDGDPHQDIELRLAIVELLGILVIIAGCGFHIVTKGWNRHVLAVSSLPKKNQARWNVEVKRIQYWLYSLMRAGYCETKEEHEISKFLLMSYLTSKSLLKVVGGQPYEIMIKSVVTFVKDYVFPLEELYAHYPRRLARTLEVICSSAHEGTNMGLKSHAAAVRASMRLDNAASAMGIQDDCKAIQLDNLVGQDMKKPDKSSWSTTPTAPYLLTYAEGLMAKTYSRADDYKVRRIGTNQFLVVYVGPTCDDNFVSRYIEGWPNKMKQNHSDSSTNGRTSKHSTSEQLPAALASGRFNSDDDSSGDDMSLPDLAQQISNDSYSSTNGSTPLPAALA